MEFILLISWTIISMMFGAMEAYLFHRDHTIGLRYPYIHVLFTVIRLVVAVLVIKACHLGYMFLIFMPIGFPFFHDGMYYYVRNKLNNRIYRMKWKARSTETTALISISRYEDRLYLVMISLFLFFWLFIINRL